ncbi:MAG: hypothetical protein QXL67_03530 [Candidatus Bathyarchaeia archaeon]
MNFIEWLTARVKTLEIAPDRVVEVKKAGKRRVSLSDCYVTTAG